MLNGFHRFVVAERDHERIFAIPPEHELWRVKVFTKLSIKSSLRPSLVNISVAAATSSFRNALAVDRTLSLSPSLTRTLPGCTKDSPPAKLGYSNHRVPL